MFIFLITDIEHSSQLWAENRAGMGEVIQIHNDLVSAAIEQFGGNIFRHTGDGIFAIFPVGADVLSCALAIQQQVNTREWAVKPFRLRIAVHQGEAERIELPHKPGSTWQSYEFIGPHVTLTEILAGHTRGGHITLTNAALQHCPLPEQAQAVPLQTFMFGQLPPLRIFSLQHPALPPAAAAALRSPLPTFELPQFEGDFLGREVEIGRLRFLIEQAKSRLISIVGPAGIGKSRLAAKAARLLAPAFPDGVLFLNLEQHASPRDLPQIILRALHMALSPRHVDHRGALLQALKSHRMLLILDSYNQGHDLEFLDQLLEQTEALHVLVTSLHPLGLPKEEVMQLHGLPYAPENAEVHEIQGYPAEQLFLQHARKHYPQFQPDPACWPAIQRICQIVDGFPLAIELASCWVGTLSCHTVAAEIEKDLSILQSDELDRPTRHLSLQAAFEYTWKHLPAHLREAHLRLTVFQGAFSAGDAEIICQVSQEQIQKLKAFGLLRHEPPNRFLLPSVLKRLAHDRWPPQHHPDWQALVERHARRFLDFLATERDHLKGDQQLSAIQRIQRSWNEITLALERGLHLGLDPTQTTQAVESVFLFLFFKGWYKEGLQVLDTASKAHGPHANRSPEHWALQAVLLTMKGWFMQVTQQKEEGLHLAYEALNYLSEEETPYHAMLTCNLLGYLLWRMQRPAKSIPLLKQGLALSRRIHDRWHEAFALNYLGNAWSDEQQYSSAITCYQEALGIRESLGDTIGKAITLNNLGFAYKEMQQYQRALACFQQALDIARTVNLPLGAALTMVNLGDIALRQQQYERALHWLHEALALRRQTGDPISEGIVLQMLGITHYRQNDLSAAIKNLKQAEDIFREEHAEEYLAHTLIHTGIVAWMQGNLSLAHHYLTTGRPNASAWGKTLADVYLVHVYLAENQTDRALAHLNEAIQAQKGQFPDLLVDTAIAVCAWKAVTANEAEAIAGLVALQQKNSGQAHLYHTADYWLRRINPSPISKPPNVVSAESIVSGFVNDLHD